MKISELIERLGELQGEHGDLEVVTAVDDPTFGDPDYTKLMPEWISVEEVYACSGDQNGYVEPLLARPDKLPYKAIGELIKVVEI